MGLPFSRAGETVVIVGGGTMGAGIAQVMLGVADQVVVVESDSDSAERAFERVCEGLRRQYKRVRDPVKEFTSARQRLSVSVGPLDGVAPSLVVEAVPESMDLKRTVLASIERAYPDVPLLATNTSSLSITELSRDMSAPDRFIGMHFFNPVPASELVELVTGTATSATATDAAKGWVDSLGKTAIIVKDSPGFATSRLGLALGLEAIRMVESGVASPEDIDVGMSLGYKHPLGPLRLTDLVGLDVRLGIAEHLAATLGPRFEPPALLRRMVAEGKLGKKTGQGFYRWDS